MRDFFPDVFDGLGFLPREYGAVQIFVEEIERNIRGRAVADIWLQAAFEPVSAEATLAVLLGNGSAGIELSVHPLPDLSNGRVVRLRLPLTVGGDTERLCFKIAAAAGPGAERVRASRRQDSQGPSVAQMGLSTRSGGGSGLGSAMARTAVLSAVALPFGFAVLSLPGDNMAEQEFISGPIGLPVEEMPHGFVARVVTGEPEPIDGSIVEPMWEIGRPMPSRDKVIRSKGGKQREAVERVCFSCGNRTESLSAASCPLCGALL